jgi:hypothetical protein
MDSQTAWICSGVACAFITTNMPWTPRTLSLTAGATKGNWLDILGMLLLRFGGYLTDGAGQPFQICECR